MKLWHIKPEDILIQRVGGNYPADIMSQPVVSIHVHARKLWCVCDEISSPDSCFDLAGLERLIVVIILLKVEGMWFMFYTVILLCIVL